MCFRGSGRQGRPRLVDDLLERLGLADRQVREDLAVELDAGELQAVHEHRVGRSEEHTSELQSLMRISYAVFCLKKKTKNNIIIVNHIINDHNREIHTTSNH